jgi:hypothetical protein
MKRLILCVALTGCTPAPARPALYLELDQANEKTIARCDCPDDSDDASSAVEATGSIVKTILDLIL